MKKFSCLVCIISMLVLVNACKPERDEAPLPTTPKLTVNSRLQFMGNIDGVPTQLEMGKNNCFPLANIITYNTSGGGIEKTSYEGGVEIRNKIFISAVIGTLDIPTGEIATEKDFNALFVTGKIAFEKYNAFIYYKDKNGEEWTTRYNQQPAESFFELKEVRTTVEAGLPTATGLLNFDCVLYKTRDTTQSIKIKDGWLVALFIAG